MFSIPTAAWARKSAPAQAEVNAEAGEKSPQVAEVAPAVVEEASSAEEPPLITNPMQMRFRVSRLQRGITPDARHFVAPRVITLTAIGPISHLDESMWRGKKLSVFHPSPVKLERAADDQSQVVYVEEKVGEIRIQSVYQATMQAVVVLDDITRGLMARGESVGVVMLGDVARLESPIKPPAKPKVRRYRKPKERSPYEREDMRWRL
jgi:hypothetical protein